MIKLSEQEENFLKWVCSEHTKKESMCFRSVLFKLIDFGFIKNVKTRDINGVLFVYDFEQTLKGLWYNYGNEIK